MSSDDGYHEGAKATKAHESRLGFLRASCSSCLRDDARIVQLPPTMRGRLSRKRSGGPMRSRSATKGCCRCSTRKGKIADKRWTFERLGSHGDSKVVLRFTAPAEVKGVALLIVNHPDRASDQWMWTPAIERDRRIALQDRSTRFFGTDFSFEDLEERDVDQYDYTLIGDDTVDGAACWKIQSIAEADEVVAVHAVDRLDPQGQLRARARSRTTSRTRSSAGSTTATSRTSRASGPRGSSRWPICAAAAARG